MLQQASPLLGPLTVLFLHGLFIWIYAFFSSTEFTNAAFQHSEGAVQVASLPGHVRHRLQQSAEKYTKHRSAEEHCADVPVMHGQDNNEDTKDSHSSHNIINFNLQILNASASISASESESNSKSDSSSSSPALSTSKPHHETFLQSVDLDPLKYRDDKVTKDKDILKDILKDNPKQNPKQNPKENSEEWSSRTSGVTCVVQVSDLHLNHIDGGVSVQNLKDFVESLKYLKPAAVLVTGDITNAKFPSFNKILGKWSKQSEQEWITYAQIVNESLAANKNSWQWWDIRGNHDSFGAKINSTNDFYSRFGFTGSAPIREHVLQSSAGFIRFIGIDYSPNPGPHRPLNFFGTMTSENYDKLAYMLGQKINDHATTILYAHYPSSLVSYPHKKSLTSLFKSRGEGYHTFDAHLSGHLHSLLGFSPEGLSALPQKGRYMELQSPDLWTTRTFRLFAFDHGIFTYESFHLNEWPQIIITNPVDASKLSPGSSLSAKFSSHIRLLLFSKDKKKHKITIKINGQVVGHALGPADENNLYLVPWNAEYYSKYLHLLEVLVDDNPKPFKSFWFSLDGSLAHISPISRFHKLIHTVLMVTDIQKISRIVCQLGIWYGLIGLLWFPAILFKLGIYDEYIKSKSSYFEPIASKHLIRDVVCSYIVQLTEFYLHRHELWITFGIVGLWLLYGPLLVIEEFISPPQMGIVYLNKAKTGDDVINGLGDIYFAVLPIVWRAYIPMIWFASLTIYNERLLASSGTSKVAQKLVRTLRLFLLLVTWFQILAWLLEICGAYGFIAIMSPLGIPLFLFVLVTSYLILHVPKKKDPAGKHIY